MIDHTGFSVTNLADSKRFYSRVLASLGHIARLDIPGKAVGFGPAHPDESADPGGAFWITQGTPSTPRMHLAFSAKNKKEVEAFHSAALAAGGIDNGAPGYRPQYHPGYYAAFIRDPDGYNIEAVYHETGK
ncbi:VOC family protein [Enterobacter sp. RHBSTW-00994]|uniref:VOC family protein n=1 Tax=Enterobacteriaceae TaxID=543 RepID=UPI0015E9B325|nr:MULTISPECIES: VOC family protein [Enterobacteriaceae]MBM3070960.1 VOC family protein [Lelliottia sp. RWM.1]QLR43019.1 VOC family protein [Enterobacter sp. RHBSTW-00994]